MKKILFITVLLVGYIAIGQKFPTGIVTGPMTTAEINAISSPQEGRQVYNETTQTIWYYNGTQWIDLGAGSGLTSSDIDTFAKLDAIVADETLSKASDIGVTVQGYNANTDTNANDDVNLTGDQSITGEKAFEFIQIDGTTPGYWGFIFDSGGNDGLSLGYQLVDGFGAGLNVPYTFRTDGSAVAGTDVITKAEADANYSGGGSSHPVDDTTPIVRDDVDNTREIGFVADNITTATRRNITMPDADVNLGNMADTSSANYFTDINNDFQSQIEIRGVNNVNEVGILNFKTFDDATTNGQLTYSKGLTLPGLGFKNTNAGANDWLVLKDAGGADYDGVFTANSFVRDGGDGTNVLLDDGTTTPVAGLGGGTDDQTASEVSNTPAGTITSTDVQAAINELDSDLTNAAINQTPVDETVSRSFTVADIGRTFDYFGASNIEMTIPDNFGSPGDWIRVRQMGAGRIRIVFADANDAFNTHETDRPTEKLVYEQLNDGRWFCDDEDGVAYTPPVTGGAQIPSSWDIASLQGWIDAREQTGADGSAITTITDQDGTVTGITTTGVVVNVNANGDREFDFSGNATARIELGQPASWDFASLTDDYTITFILGEVQHTGGSGGTIFAKNDKTLGVAQHALYLTTPATGAAWGEWYGHGSSLTLGDVSSVDTVVTIVGTTMSTFNRIEVYINGTSIGTFDTSETAVRAAGWVLGAQTNGGGFDDPFSGSLIAFGIHNEALSSTVINNGITDYNNQ